MNNSKYRTTMNSSKSKKTQHRMPLVKWLVHLEFEEAHLLRQTSTKGLPWWRDVDGKIIPHLGSKVGEALRGVRAPLSQWRGHEVHWCCRAKHSGWNIQLDHVLEDCRAVLLVAAKVMVKVLSFMFAATGVERFEKWSKYMGWLKTRLAAVLWVLCSGFMV